MYISCTFCAKMSVESSGNSFNTAFGLMIWMILNWSSGGYALINGPRQANLVLIAYASSEGSGEPAHPRSLARTFAARSYKH